MIIIPHALVNVSLYIILYSKIIILYSKIDAMIADNSPIQKYFSSVIEDLSWWIITTIVIVFGLHLSHQHH